MLSTRLQGHLEGRQRSRLVGALALLLAGAPACGDDSGDVGSTRQTPNPAQSGDDAGIPGDAAIVSSSEQGETRNGQTFTSDAPESSPSTDHPSTSGGSTSAPPGTSPTTSPSDTTSSATTSSATSSATSTATNTSNDWMPVEPPFDDHESCQERSNTADLACSYGLQCVAKSYQADCTLRDDGTWRCSCRNLATNDFESFTLEGADAETACREGMRVCVPGQTPELAEPECEYVDAELSDTYCRRSTLCTSTAQLTPNVVAKQEVETQLDYCSGAGGSMECRCLGSYETHTVYGADGMTACGLMTDLCEGTQPIGEERTCGEASQTVSSSSCSFQESCGRRTELAQEGAYVLSGLEYTTSQCTLYDPAEPADCSCSDSASYISIRVQGAALTETCRVASSFCSDTSSLTEPGELDCPDQTTNVTGSSCSTWSNCGWTASYDGADVTAYAPLRAQCTKSGTEWTCECSSLANLSEPFTLTSNDGFEACAQANSVCATMVVELEVSGSYESEFVFGPRPAPSDSDAGSD